MMDREHIERDGPGRRKTDHVCLFHDLLQAETKEHRAMVCKKIAAKADGSELRGFKVLITALVTIVCLVVAGQAAWLLMGIKDVKQEAVSAVSKTDALIHDGFATLHRRVTEQAAAREQMDNDQSKQLSEIKNQIGVITWRLGQIEESHKALKK